MGNGTSFTLERFPPLARLDRERERERERETEREDQKDKKKLSFLTSIWENK